MGMLILWEVWCYICTVHMEKNLQHNISDDIHWRSLVSWICQPRPNSTPRSPLPQSILLSSRGKQNPSLSVLNQPPNHNRAVLPSSLHNQILLKAPIEPSPTFPVLSFPLLLKQPSTGKKFLLVRFLVGDCYSTRGRYVLIKKRQSSNPLLIYSLHSGNAILITGRQRYNRYYHPVM